MTSGMSPPCPRPPVEELRALYLDSQVGMRVIGKRYGVSRGTVRQWLRTYEIPVKPTGNGLAQRGLAMPTRDELERLIYADRLTYKEVGKRYGVDKTAVPYWLDRYGIPRPTRTRINFEVVRDLYTAGLSAEVIGKDLGCSKSTILSFLHQMGISRRAEGWRGLIRARDGQLVRSTYELRVADWLSGHGIVYEYEPRVPFGHGNTRADFLANGWYIEVWGVHSNAPYKRKREAKVAAYHSLSLPLIELCPNHFSARDGHLFEHRLSPCLQPVV